MSAHEQLRRVLGEKVVGVYQNTRGLDVKDDQTLDVVLTFESGRRLIVSSETYVIPEEPRLGISVEESS